MEKSNNRLRILVINPGSTSTRIAVFENENSLFNLRIQHSDSILSMPLFSDQYELRKKAISDAIENKGYSFSDFSAIAARGGRLKPVKSGVYRVNKSMAEHARMGLQGEHPANLAVVMAEEFSQKYLIPAFTVDPISVDELADVARITGLKGIKRTSLSHALNMKIVAKKAAKKIGKRYEDARLIIVHLGGGGSVSAHLHGEMVDLYNSDKEGPFSIERAGNMPSIDLVNYILEKHLNAQQVIKKLAHEGGLYSYFHTRDIKKIEEIFSKNQAEKIVLEAYVYNIAKYVCSFLPIFNGVVDAVVFTGGVCYSKLVKKLLIQKLSFLGKLLWYPGGYEEEALALNVLAVLKEELKAYEY